MSPTLEDLGGDEFLRRRIPRYVLSGWGRGRMEIIVAELFVGEIRAAWVGVSFYPDGRAVIAGTLGHWQAEAVSADEVRAFLRASLEAIGAAPMAHSAPQALHARVRAIVQAYERMHEYPPGDPAGVFEFDDQVTVVADSLTRDTLRENASHWWRRQETWPPDDDSPPLSPLKARMVEVLASEAAGESTAVPNAWRPDDDTHVPPEERDWDEDFTRTRYLISRREENDTAILLVELFGMASEPIAWAEFTLDERGSNDDERWTSTASVTQLASHGPFGLANPPLSQDWMPSMGELRARIEHAFARAGVPPMPETSAPALKAQVLEVLRQASAADSDHLEVPHRNLPLEANLITDAIRRNRLDDLLQDWPGSDLGTAADRLRERYGDKG